MRDGHGGGAADLPQRQRRADAHLVAGILDHRPAEILDAHACPRASRDQQQERQRGGAGRPRTAEASAAHRRSAAGPRLGAGRCAASRARTRRRTPSRPPPPRSRSSPRAARSRRAPAPAPARTSPNRWPAGCRARRCGPLGGGQGKPGATARNRTPLSVVPTSMESVPRAGTRRSAPIPRFSIAAASNSRSP